MNQRLLIRRIKNKIKKDGLIGLIYGLFIFFRQKIKWIIYKKKLVKMNTIEERFEAIYASNLWGSDESVSGFGSTLKYTENLRYLLIELIDKYKIESILDAPCGDFNWMKEVVRERPSLRYIGGDIVRDLIERNNGLFKKENIDFMCMNIVKDSLPRADLMICRDCLFHLSEKDIICFMENFLKSDIRYLLTTSHCNEGNKFSNKDIVTGDFRLLDLFGNPYNFSHNYLLSIEDWMEPEPKRFMFMWDKDTLSLAFEKNNVIEKDNTLLINS